MKKIFFVFGIFLSLLVLIFSSCDKTEDSTSPEGDARDVLVGTWVTSETSQNFGATTFTLTISKSTSDKENIIIRNFYNLGNTTNTIGKVNGTTIILSSQQISSQTIVGSGTFQDGKITWTYNTDDGAGQKDNCSASSTK